MSDHIYNLQLVCLLRPSARNFDIDAAENMLRAVSLRLQCNNTASYQLYKYFLVFRMATNIRSRQSTR